MPGNRGTVVGGLPSIALRHEPIALEISRPILPSDRHARESVQRGVQAQGIADDFRQIGGEQHRQGGENGEHGSNLGRTIGIGQDSCLL